MRYELSVIAYDVMDEVWLAVVLRGQPATGESTPPLRVTIQGSIPGTGELDAHQWARDALVGALELL